MSCRKIEGICKCVQCRLNALEGIVYGNAEVKVEMKPKPTGLIEAVEEFLNEAQCVVCPNLRLALAREKRIVEKRNGLFSELRHHAQFSTWDENQVTDILECLRELDKECAK